MEKLKEEIPSEKNLNDDYSLKKRKDPEASERIAEIFSIQQKNNTKDLVEKVTIGGFLKRERESKQYSLKKISNRTKISITILEQLENDKFIDLPSRAYVRGFVRSYAQVLGVSLDLCQEILEHTYNGMSVSEKAVKKITAFDAPPVKSHTTFIQLAMLVSGVLTLIIFAAYTIRNTQKENRTEVERPIIPIAVNSKTPLKGVGPLKELSEEKKNNNIKLTEMSHVPTAEIIKTKTTVATSAFRPGEKIETVNDSFFIKPHELKIEKKIASETKKIIETKKEISAVPTSAPLSTPSTQKEKTIETKSMESVLYSEVSIEENEKNKEYLPDNIKAAIIPGLQNLFINAITGNSWITYKKDAEPIKKFILQQGKTILIRGKEIRVFLGNTGASKVYLNNKLLNLNAPTGVKSLVFPQENANKYKIPLFIYKESGEVITSDNI